MPVNAAKLGLLAGSSSVGYIGSFSQETKPMRMKAKNKNFLIV
jgi:hypothetical protein